MRSLGKDWAGSQTFGKSNHGRWGRGKKYFSEQKEEPGRVRHESGGGRKAWDAQNSQALASGHNESGYCISQDGM